MASICARNSGRSASPGSVDRDMSCFSSMTGRTKVTQSRSGKKLRISMRTAFFACSSVREQGRAQPRSESRGGGGEGHNG